MRKIVTWFLVLIITLSLVLFAIERFFFILSKIDRLNRELAYTQKGLQVEIEALKKSREKQELFFRVSEELVKKAEALKMRKENPIELTPMMIIDIAQTIVTLADIYSKDGLTVGLIMALIEQESNFDPYAISEARAYGLLQIIETTAIPYLKILGYQADKNLLFNPVINLQVGIMHLMDLHRYWMEQGKETLHDFKLSFHSYFWGPRLTWELLLTRQRVNIPSLEYSNSIIDKAKKWEIIL